MSYPIAGKTKSNKKRNCNGLENLLVALEKVGKWSLRGIFKFSSHCLLFSFVPPFLNTFVIAKEGSKAVDEVKFLLLVNAPGHTYTPTDATGSPDVQTVPYELGIWVLETEQGIEFQMYVAFSSIYFFYEYSWRRVYKSVNNDSKKAHKHGSVFEQHVKVLGETIN